MPIKVIENPRQINPNNAKLVKIYVSHLRMGSASFKILISTGPKYWSLGSMVGASVSVSVSVAPVGVKYVVVVEGFSPGKPPLPPVTVGIVKAGSDGTNTGSSARVGAEGITSAFCTTGLSSTKGLSSMALSEDDVVCDCATLEK